MVRYFAAALVAIAIVVGTGYLVRDHLFAATPSRPPAIAVVVTTAVDAAVPERQTSVVVDLDGRVEKRAGTTWLPVAIGDELSPQDSIRTGEDAHAHIKTGAQLVELGDRSEVTVGEISATVSQFLLSEGRVTANTGPTRGHTIRIETRGTVAETDAGTFAVASAGDVAVAAERGNVTVTAQHESIQVHAGEQTIVATGAAPSAPTRIPASLFLKVSAGGRDAIALLHGETEPGAIVSINGVRSLANAKGGFDSNVALTAGDNVIVVSVQDATGRSKQQVIKRNLDRTKPAIKTEVDWK